MIHMFLTKNAGTMPFSFVVMPLLILGLLFELLLLGKRRDRFLPNINLGLSVASFFLVSVSLLQLVKKPCVDFFVGGWPPPYGIQVSLFFFNWIILLMASLCFVVISFIGKHHRLPIHSYPVFILLFIGVFGVIHSADLFNMFVYLEIMSIASYILASISNSAGRWKSTLLYLLSGAMMTSFYLMGVVLIYGVYSTLNLYNLSDILSTMGITQGGVLAFIFMILALLFKSAVFPFHFWKPGVMKNTNPAMTVFFGALSPIVGFYLFLRILNIFFIQQLYIISCVFGMVTMLLALFLAVRSEDIMSVLAYASIFQTGLLFFAYGMSVFIITMKTYALMHLIALFVFETLMFGSLALRHTIGQNITEKFFMLALLGSVGIPFTAGFPPKIFMIVDSFFFNPLLATVFVFMFILSVAYAIKAYTLYAEHRFIRLEAKHVYLTTLFILTLLAIALVLLGLFPQGMIYIAKQAIFSLQIFGA